MTTNTRDIHIRRFPEGIAEEFRLNALANNLSYTGYIAALLGLHKECDRDAKHIRSVEYILEELGLAKFVA